MACATPLVVSPGRRDPRGGRSRRAVRRPGHARRRRRARRRRWPRCSTTPSAGPGMGAAGRRARRGAVQLARGRRGDRRGVRSEAIADVTDEESSVLTVDFDRLGLRPGDRVLDMGCGAGRHAFEMYRRGADVIAFDQDADELARRARPVRRDARGGRGARRAPRPTSRRATRWRCPSPTASSTGSWPPRCSSTSPPTSRRSPSWCGCCAPAARSRSRCRAGSPRWSAGRCRDDYHDTPGGHIRIYTDAELVGKVENAGLVYEGTRLRPRPARAVLVDQVRGRRATTTTTRWRRPTTGCWSGTS